MWESKMKKLLLISALIVPTMASVSNYCNAVSDFGTWLLFCNGHWQRGRPDFNGMVEL